MAVAPTPNTIKQKRNETNRTDKRQSNFSAVSLRSALHNHCVGLVRKLTTFWNVWLLTSYFFFVVRCAVARFVGAIRHMRKLHPASGKISEGYCYWTVFFVHSFRCEGDGANVYFAKGGMKWIGERVMEFWFRFNCLNGLRTEAAGWRKEILSSELFILNYSY